jgi:hypothetical protein
MLKNSAGHPTLAIFAQVSDNSVGSILLQQVLEALVQRVTLQGQDFQLKKGA